MTGLVGPPPQHPLAATAVLLSPKSHIHSPIWCVTPYSSNYLLNSLCNRLFLLPWSLGQDLQLGG